MIKTLGGLQKTPDQTTFLQTRAPGNESWADVWVNAVAVGFSGSSTFDPGCLFVKEKKGEKEEKEALQSTTPKGIYSSEKHLQNL